MISHLMCGSFSITRIYIAGVLRPLFSVCLEVFEGLAIQLNQSLTDNRLVFAMSSLHVHHLGDGHTACNPLSCRFGQVGNLGKVTIVTILDQHECIVT